MVLRSGREMAARNILGEDLNTQAKNDVDLESVAAALKQAQVAQKKGQHRLALLLAHQCDCISNRSSHPELAALLAELGAEQFTIN